MLGGAEKDLPNCSVPAVSRLLCSYQNRYSSQDADRAMSKPLTFPILLGDPDEGASQRHQPHICDID